jgi:hemolysin activation/secretion protein
VQAPPTQMLLRRQLGGADLLTLVLAGVLLAAPTLAADGPPIKSLMLLSAPEPNILAGIGIDLSHIQAPEPEALRTRLTPLLNASVSPPALQQIRQAILDHYKDAGHPFLDVGFPPQDVTDGKLSVIVTEYRVGTVKPQGNVWFSDRLLVDTVALKPGSTIDKSDFDRRVAELNANPFLKMTPEFQSGHEPGTTDVTLKTEDRFPVDFSLGYANTGNPTTGWDRWNLGATWGDALHLGQTLTYQLSTSSDFWHGLEHDMLRSEDASFVGHTIAWSAPLRWGHTLQLTGGYSRQVPQIGPDLGSVGITDLLGAVYQIPLSETQQLAFGVDYKRSNNQLSFGGVTVQSGFTEVEEASVRYNLAMSFSHSQTLVENVLYVSPGGLTSLNRDSSFQPSGTVQSGTPGAKARYAYDKLTVTEIVPLPREFGLVFRVTGQEATGTLLPSEQLSIAGSDAVRGYQEFGLAGSRGLLLSAELRGPVFHTGLPNDSLQPHIFFDQGQAWNPTASQAAPAYSHSSSAGVGGRYQVDRYFSLRMEQGWQLTRSDRQAANGAFMHIAATATW